MSDSFFAKWGVDNLPIKPSPPYVMQETVDSLHNVIYHPRLPVMVFENSEFPVVYRECVLPTPESKSSLSTLDKTMELIEEKYRDYLDYFLEHIGLCIGDINKTLEFSRESVYERLFAEVEFILDETTFGEGWFSLPTEFKGEIVNFANSVCINDLSTLVTNFGNPLLLCDTYLHCWLIENEIPENMGMEIRTPEVNVRQAVVELLEQGFFNLPIETESNNDIPFEREVAPWEVEEVA